jgi:uridine kinase
MHALPRRRLTLLVAVDGAAHSGKTTFTRALAALDPGLDVIEMRDFGLPAWTSDQHADRSTASAGDLVDWRRLRSGVLLPLSRDQPARYQRYDSSRGATAEWRVVPVGGIVIVEGRFASLRPLITFYDFRVWVECPPEVRGHRARNDDRGFQQEEAWMRAQEEYLVTQDPPAAAHLRVDGSGTVEHDPAGEYVRLR